MLDLPGHPTLDKLGLIGTCSRLPVRVNAGAARRRKRGPDSAPECAWVDQAMRSAH